MSTDPILEQVHTAKDAVAREANCDLRVLCAQLRKAEQRHPERLADRKSMIRTRRVEKK